MLCLYRQCSWDLNTRSYTSQIHVKSGTKIWKKPEQAGTAGTTLEQLWNNLKWRANDSAVQVQFIIGAKIYRHSLSASASGSWSEPEPEVT